MFDFFSWQHLSIMLIVALVVVGPKDLPRLMNMAGKWAGKARTMAGEFRRSFDEMARESELAELRKEIDNLKKNNPVTDVMGTMSGVQADIGNPMEGAGIAVESAAPAASSGAEPRSGELQVTESAPQQPAPGTPSSLQA
jgi:sec-independent protein translocase protein TatB